MLVLGACFLSSDITHLHLRPRFAGGEDLGALVTVTVEPAAPDPREEMLEFGAARSGAQCAKHVPAERCEKAGVQLPVGREARAVTIPAKRLGDGTDQPDLALAVHVSITGSDLAAVCGTHRLQRPAFADPPDDLLCRHHALRRPVVGVAHVHELDEPKRVPATAKIVAEREQLSLV